MGNPQIFSKKGFFIWELEGTGVDVENTTSAQHRFTNFQIILES